jgi:hypothetical protein
MMPPPMPPSADTEPMTAPAPRYAGMPGSAPCASGSTFGAKPICAAMSIANTPNTTSSERVPSASASHAPSSPPATMPGARPRTAGHSTAP